MTPKLTFKDIERYEMNKTRCVNNMITEEEKIRRRELLEMNFNIIGSGFGGDVNPTVKNQPYWEQYINGDITLEELCDAIDRDVKSC